MKHTLFFLICFSALLAQAQQKELLVTDFGAVGDGTTLNTSAIQSAIDAANKRKKGGKVIFPKGKFLSGTLEIKSNVTLYLEEGATLLGSTNPYHYPKSEQFLKLKESPKKDDNSKLALLLSFDAQNIKVTGKGTIDGQGRKLAYAVDSLHHIGEVVDPNYNYKRSRPAETMRPKLINFIHCNDVEVSGLELKNAACWLQTYELCQNLVLDHLKVFNRAFWNNDGMDISDCHNVRITHCDVDTADDGICLKSYHPGEYNNNIYIANCTVRSSASAVKFGTASFGGFKNVTIDSIQVFDTFRSAIAIESVDGGVIDNIKVSNIVAKNTGNAIFIRLGHRAGEKPGTVKNIHISNMNVEVPFGRPDINYDMRGPEVNFFHNPFPSSIAGIPDHNIENVVLENIEITFPGRASKGMAYIPLWRLASVPEKIRNYPEFSMFGELPSWGMYVRHTKNIAFKNVVFKLQDHDFRPAYVFDSVDGLEMDGISLSPQKHRQIILKNTSNIIIEEDTEKLTKTIE